MISVTNCPVATVPAPPAVTATAPSCPIVPARSPAEPAAQEVCELKALTAPTVGAFDTKASPWVNEVLNEKLSQLVALI